MTAIQTAVDMAGSRSDLAQSLNPPVTVQAVCQWIMRGWVPMHRALEIERLYGIDRALLVKPALAVLLDSPAGHRQGREVQS